MGVGDSLKQATGNIEKAVIVITDMRGRTKQYEKPVPAESEQAGLPGVSLPNVDTSKISDAVQKGTGLNVNPPALTEGITKKEFHVQFNPNTLAISGYGGGWVQKTDYSAQNTGNLGYGKMDVQITLNVTLIFDQVNPKDAFMMDKFAMSGTGIVTGVAQAGMKIAGKLNYSVQPQIEGFIAALRNKDTRNISFNWGDMSYTGILNRVSSKYTMFSVSGQPIRGEVGLSLVCADQGVSENSMGRWKNLYDGAFKKGNSSYTKANQRVGNLLNFNL